MKFEDYIRSSKQAESLQLLPALLNTAQRQQREATLLGLLLDKLTLELGVIDVSYIYLYFYIYAHSKISIGNLRAVNKLRSH